MKKTLIVMMGLAMTLPGGAAVYEMFPQEKAAGGGILQVAAPQGGGLRKRLGTPAQQRALPAPQDKAVYPFFSGATYTTTVTRVSQGFGGAEIVEGGVPGTGLLSLSTYMAGEERHEVHFTESGRVYIAVTRPDGTMEMQEHDPSLEPSWDEHAVAEGGEEDEGPGMESPLAVMASSSVEIDVMMVFDTTAVAWAQSNGGITNFANSAVSRMSTALANSGIDCTMRLAGIYCPPYTYEGDISAALTALRTGTGDLSGVAAQRNACGADVVSMMVDTGSAYGTTGIGYMSVISAQHVGANAAFSVCSVRAVNNSHTMSHEIGHNIGCDHSKYQQSSPAPSGTYAAGWYFTGNNSIRYHTIMAYNSDGINSWTYQPCGLFSSPLLTYQGTVAGHAADGDNTRCITENMAAVAAYRIPPLNITFGEALGNTLSWETGGNVPWLVQNQISHSGPYAAQSGSITHSQNSWIETTVTGPGNLAFWWRVSSESSYDWLTCTTNGTLFTRISGTNVLSWAQQQVSLPPGQTTIRWTYSKDISASLGLDCGWLDDVTWAPLLLETQTTPRPVPFTWLDEMYPGNNGDYEALAFLPGANGLPIWESYVAGLVPTNANSKFLITGLQVNGTGITFDWTPHRSDRTYTVWGKTNLTDKTWGPTNATMKFFKVSVDL